MSEPATDGTEPGVTTIVSVRRPDGTVLEIEHNDQGQVVSTRIESDGTVADRIVAKVLPAGFEVTRHNAVGERDDVSPESATQQINVYGTTVEQLQFDGLTVEQVFDDDARLRSVRMLGVWGEHSMELRPDGSRTLTWDTPFHQGSRTWNAGGVSTHYEVRSSDGTSYRRDVVGDLDRETVVGWDGETKVIEHPHLDRTA